MSKDSRFSQFTLHWHVKFCIELKFAINLHEDWILLLNLYRCKRVYVEHSIMRGSIHCFSIHDCMYPEAATRDQPLSSILRRALISRQESSVYACMVAIASCETTV